MEPTILRLFMKKFTLLVITNKSWDYETFTKKRKMIEIIQINNIEHAIEKMQNHSINAIAIDQSYDEKDLLKLVKIAELLNESIDYITTSFSNYETIDNEFMNLWKSYFRKKTFGFELEDAPNLNNPFLNIDKTNIFNRFSKN